MHIAAAKISATNFLLCLLPLYLAQNFKHIVCFECFYSKDT